MRWTYRHVVFLISVIAAMSACVWLVTASLRQSLEPKMARNHVATIGRAIQDYVTEHRRLPGSPRKPTNFGSDRESWRVLIEPQMKRHLPHDARLPEYAHVFALLSEESVWNATEVRFPEDYGKYGAQVVVVCLLHVPSKVRWSGSSELVLKEDRVFQQGRPDASINWTGALVLRLNGSIEMIPESFSREKIVRYLKQNKSFIE